MKAIKLINTDFIIREVNSFKNRDENEMEITFSLEPIYGVVLNQTHKDLLMKSAWVIKKENHKKLWEEFKDASNEQTIQKFKDILIEYKNILNLHNEEEPKRLEVRFVREIIDGVPTEFFENENKNLFEESKKRTSMEPLKIKLPNKYNDKKDEIYDGNNLRMIQDFISHLEIKFDLLNIELKVIDI